MDGVVMVVLLMVLKKQVAVVALAEMVKLDHLPMPAIYCRNRWSWSKIYNCSVGTVGVTGVGAPGPGSPGYNWFAGGGGARSNGTGGGGGGTSVGNSWSGGGSGANGGRTNGSDGTPGSGGGGGGAGNAEPAFNGGAGVVVVRYKIADTEANTSKASGGSISFYNDGGTVRALHVFTGTQPFQVTNGPVTCSFFIVAGGGGGGFDAAGGGGGGGVVYLQDYRC